MGISSFKNSKSLDPKAEKTINFGGVVAMSGDIVVVGEKNYSEDTVLYKNCYVFTREKGEFKYLQTLESGDKGAVSFGFSVAIDGAHIVVGAPYENKLAGRAYVFTKKGNKFVRNSEPLVSKDPTPEVDGDWKGGFFGTSVAIDGAHIVVGASNENSSAGRAYVFTKQGNKFVRNSEALESEDPTFFNGPYNPGGHFGSSVAIDGANIVVGASGENSVAGRAYVFTKKGNKFVRNSDPLESEHPTFTSIEKPGGLFGGSVAIDGAHIVVGAPYENGVAGRAYVFTKQGNKFVRNSEALESGNPKGSFGISVAIDGAHIVVGAPYENSSAGRAYVFTKQGNKFVRNSDPLISEHPTPEVDGDGKGGFFGASVAIDGAHIVVGASNENEGAGRAYVFTKGT